MTRKQIDASRETRLWITQIVVPITSVAIATLGIPEVRQAIAAKAEAIKFSIQEKMHK